MKATWVCFAILLVMGKAGAQVRSDTTRVTLRLEAAPLGPTLRAIAGAGHRSLVIADSTSGVVTADVVDEPWQSVLEAIVEANGMVLREVNGILFVERRSAKESAAAAPPETRTYRLSRARARPLADALKETVGTGTSIGVDEPTNTLIATGPREALDRVAVVVATLDVPPAQMAIEARIVYIDRSKLDELGVNWEYHRSSTGPDEVTVTGPGVEAAGTLGARVDGQTLRLLTQLTHGGYTFGAFVDATRSIDASTTKARPQVQVMDHERAEIFVGTEFPVRTVDYGSGAEQKGSSLSPRVTVSMQKAGIRLSVTPSLTAGDRIVLDVEAENSSPGAPTVDGGITLNRQSANATLTVADGRTAALAGLTITDTVETRTSIPWLSELPYIGRLFVHVGHRERTRDLVIEITPHIVRL